MRKQSERIWRLSPVRHEEPRYEEFADEESVRGFERATRTHRALSERFEIFSAGAEVAGTYRVQGESGRAYLVDLVDASGEHDACSCPDFLTNEIGTCKHLEAVRRIIEEDRRLGTQFARLGRMPEIPTITVDGRGALKLRLVGRRAASYARSAGLKLAEDGGLLSPNSLLPTEALHGRVVHAAPQAFEIIRARHLLTERQSELMSARSDGRLHLDVLRESLFPYQELGVLHLASAGRALLADDMGLGKTVQAIAACEILRARGEVRRALIVTPASLKDQWAREIRRYTGAQPIVVGGSVNQRHAALSSDSAYTITNYELTWRDLSLLQNLQPDLLIFDEAQRAKNFRTKTAATLRAMRSRFLFVLTGTPIENRLDDLYSLLQLVDPAILGPLWRFNHEFHEQNARGKIVGYKRLSELRTRIAPVVLRRRKEEVLTQLPPLTQQTRYVELSPAQTELEEHFRTEAAKLLATAERRALRPEEQKRLMAMLLKARQACDAAELCDPGVKEAQSSPKLNELEQLVREIVEQGADKILIFSEWTEMLRLCANRLDKMGVGYVLLHGGVPTDRRPALLDGFRQDGEKRVLLSTDAGGVGLNLQVASYVIHLDLPWNPGRLDQRTARAHRLGQTRGVSVTYLCSATGIERGIEGTLSGKRALRGAALDPESETDSLDAPSFSMFMKELRETLTRMEAGALSNTPSMPDTIVEVAVPEILDAQLLEAQTAEAAPAIAAISGSVPVEWATARSTESAPLPPSAPRSRLRLAAIVLEAGFPGDAVRAACDGLGRAARALLPGEVGVGHTALVAAIYRDLVPMGRVAPAFHAVLARLYDLSQLDAHDVPLDKALATEAIAEAGHWLERLEAGLNPLALESSPRPEIRPTA